MLLLAPLMIASRPAAAYGVLTHQQLIDQSWNAVIAPLLVSRYPQLTADELKRAHAYAYGGCVIQDLGYYPLSNGFFSDLTHYVRSGDFVRSLFRNANSPNQLAFAIGALAHYFGDTIGHSQLVNPSVGAAFPKLSSQYGPSPNYAQDKIAHSRVEFAFDVNQAAKHRVAPYDYVTSIGLEVPWDQVAAAFQETYGFPLRDILGQYGNALRAYRFGARRFLPALTYAEALLHHRRLPDDTAGPQSDLYERRTARLARDAEWDRYRKKPGVGTHLLAALIVVLPKIGPIKMLAIKGPSAESERLYIESVNLSTTALALALEQLGVEDDPARHISDAAMADAVRKENAGMSVVPGRGAAVPPVGPRVTLPANLVPNRDLDTGRRVTPGGYRLTDDTYARLLAKVTKDSTRVIREALKHDILDYYSDPDSPISTRRDATKWAQVQHHLEALRALRVDPVNP